MGGVTCSDASTIGSASTASIGGANPTDRDPVLYPRPAQLPYNLFF